TIMAVSGSGLLLTSGVWCSYERLSARRRNELELVGMARVVAASCAAPLGRSEPDAVARVLQSLAAQPQIAAAYAFDARQQKVAEYLRTAAAASRAGAPADDSIAVEEDAVVAGQPVGRIALRADAHEPWSRVAGSAAVMFAMASAVFALVFMLSRQTGRWIS